MDIIGQALTEMRAEAITRRAQREWAANAASAVAATLIPATPVRRPRRQGWNDFEDAR